MYGDASGLEPRNYPLAGKVRGPVAFNMYRGVVGGKLELRPLESR